MSTRRIGPMGVRRDMRPIGAIAGGSADAAWDPLDLSPEVFAIIDDDYITQSGTISDVVNQGSDGGSFAQAVAGARPTYVANHYGTGLHAADFGGDDWLTLAAASLGGAAITVVVGGSVDDTSAISAPASYGNPNYHLMFVAATTGVPYVLSSNDAGQAQAYGTAAFTTPKMYGGEYVVARDSDGAVYIDGADDTGSNLGANNLTAFASGMPLDWGALYSSLFPHRGPMRFIFAINRALTAGEWASLDTWARGEMGR